jgi:hypothetical protein
MPILVSASADINCNGAIDIYDLIIVTGDFGKTSGFNNSKSDNSILNNIVLDCCGYKLYVAC